MQEIDFLAMPLYYPLDDELGRIIHMPVINEDTMEILSFYNTSSDFRVGNIFTMFASIPFGLWVGYLCSFSTFVTFICLGSFILNRKYFVLWPVISAYLNQNAYPIQSNHIATLSLIVMICSFFIISYATNSMSSDLVSFDKPIVIQSYDDIIDRKVKVVMWKEFPKYSRFADADIGSKENKIFKLIEPLVVEKYSLPAFYTQEQILIGRRMVTMANGIGAVVLDTFPKSNGHMLISADREAKKYSNFFILSKKWHGTQFEYILHRL